MSTGVTISDSAALAPLASPSRAADMSAYMKDVAPFLGVSAPDRRRVLRGAWAGLPPLAPDDVVETGTIVGLGWFCAKEQIGRAHV